MTALLAIPGITPDIRIGVCLDCGDAVTVGDVAEGWSSRWCGGCRTDGQQAVHESRETSMQIEHIDGFAIPTIKQRGTPRTPEPPNPSPAATAVLKALHGGDPKVIAAAIDALAFKLAKVEVGSDELPIRMTRAQQTAYRRAERMYRTALPRMTHDRLRALCLELGGTEPVEPTPIAISSTDPDIAELLARADAAGDDDQTAGLDDCSLALAS